MPLHNIIGELCPTQPEPREDSGKINIRLSVPSAFTNMCGWFYEMTTNIFGVIDKQKIWVVLHKNNAKKRFCIAYDSKFSGDAGLKRTIDCSLIKSITSQAPTTGTVLSTNANLKLNPNSNPDSNTYYNPNPSTSTSPSHNP